MNKEEIRKEIYWLFKDTKHNGHRQIYFKDKKVHAYKAEEEKHKHLCYVCDTLNKLEHKIAKLFGEEKYYKDTLEKDGGKQNGTMRLHV